MFNSNGIKMGKTEVMRRWLAMAPPGQYLVISSKGTREVEVRGEVEVVESKPLPRKELVHDQP